MYSYANYNPFNTSYNFNSSEIESYALGLVSPTLVPISFNRLNLPKVPWLIDNATTIYGALSSLHTGIPIFAHYAKYANFINYEFKLYGISKRNTSLQLSNINFKTTGLEWGLIGIDALIDMYDSYQRGVSTSGILLGGTLTVASDIGLLYLNKGIMWLSTTIGTAIYPGLGTAIGFGVGLAVSILVDILLGKWISDLINRIAK